MNYQALIVLERLLYLLNALSSFISKSKFLVYLFLLFQHFLFVYIVLQSWTSQQSLSPTLVNLLIFSSFLFILKLVLLNLFSKYMKISAVRVMNYV